MKKKIFGLLFIVFAAAVMSVTANAEDITDYVDFSRKTGMITFCESYVRGDIVIPSEIDGVKVVGIGEKAFSGCRNITSVTISEGVVSIGESAFENCRAMKKVTFPESLISIGDAAFFNCMELEEIVMPNGLTSIGTNVFYNTGYYYNEDNWENNALYIGKYLLDAREDEIGSTYAIRNGTTLIAGGTFMLATKLTKITMPDGMENIGAYAFSKSGLKSVRIPDSVKRIDAYAFSETNLPDVTIPAGVEEIHGAAFALTESLESINVSSGNKYYTSENGVLFSKDKTVLVIYPVGRTDDEYVIPKGVTSIGEYALYECSALRVIWIPATVSSIESYAFGNYILGNNMDLSDAYYEADENEVKDNLTIAGGNLKLKNANQHYNAPCIPPITVEIESNFTGDTAVFGLTMTEGSKSALKKVRLYLAEYDSDGRVTNTYVGINSEMHDDEMTITAPLPSEDAYSYKYMLWDKSNAPLMDAIMDISRE